MKNTSLLNDNVKKLIYKYMHADISPVHYWGDSWEYWEELRIAIDEMSDAAYQCRMSVYDKEKFGSYNCSVIRFWQGELLKSSMYGSCWYNKLDNLNACFLRAIGVVKLINYFQKIKYNKLVQNVIRNHPTLVNELLVDNDLYYLITPGKYGVANGDFVYNKYWETQCK